MSITDGARVVPSAWKAAVRREAVRVDHQPPEEELVEQALLEAVGELGEVGEVGEDPGGVRDVLGRHPDLVGGAEDEAVVVGQVLLVLTADLVAVPNSPWP